MNLIRIVTAICFTKTFFSQMWLVFRTDLYWTLFSLFALFQSTYDKSIIFENGDDIIYGPIIYSSHDVWIFFSPCKNHLKGREKVGQTWSGGAIHKSEWKPNIHIQNTFSILIPIVEGSFLGIFRDLISKVNFWKKF